MQKKIFFESEHINEEFGLSGINILCYKVQQNVAKEATLIIILLLRYIESSFYFGGLTLSGVGGFKPKLFSMRQLDNTTKLQGSWLNQVYFLNTHIQLLQLL